MPRQRTHPDRVVNPVGMPGPGTRFVGYLRYSSREQSPQTFATQRHWIEQTASAFSWSLIGWFEEPKESARYEEIERRPQFQALLAAAGKQFQGILCYHLDRWSRNAAVTYGTLARLRQQKVWWQSVSDGWDIDVVQQPGSSKLFSLAVQDAADYLTRLSERTINAKLARSAKGLHNGNVIFGYLPPDHPQLPATPDPINFAALIKLGELAAQGMADQQIADLLADARTHSSRYGERLPTKDTVAAIRRSSFPREFVSGCGHGTIVSPAGELVEGRHVAAWSFELSQRMDAAVAQRRHQGKSARPPTVYPFSRTIVCSACRRQLRSASAPNGLYYKDTSRVRKLPCSAFGCLSVRADTLTQQFAALLRQVQFTGDWQTPIVTRCKMIRASIDSGSPQTHRQALEAEQSRLIDAYRKGYIDDRKLGEDIAELRKALARIPMVPLHDFEGFVERALEVAEMLSDLATYWDTASIRRQHEVVAALFMPEGIIYDLQRQLIIGLRPRPEALPALETGLAHQWHGGESSTADQGHAVGEFTNMLWLKPEYYDLYARRSVTAAAEYQPAQRTSISKEQREQALALLATDQSLRQIADQLGVSYWVVLRLAQRFADSGTERPRHQRPKLTDSQQQEALDLLAQGLSLRAVAKQFGVSYASIDRIKQRERMQQAAQAPLDNSAAQAGSDSVEPERKF
jgi:DNA invertase Pin-like site-specific DNA recombinase